jgi:hypothetical protein
MKYFKSFKDFLDKRRYAYYINKHRSVIYKVDLIKLSIIASNSGDGWQYYDATIDGMLLSNLLFAMMSGALPDKDITPLICDENEITEDQANTLIMMWELEK